MVAALRMSPWKGLLCITHTLQIDVCYAVDLSPVAEKLVGHFNHSVTAKNALEDAQRRLGLSTNKLIQEVTTRLFEISKWLSEQQAAFSAVLAESSKPSDRDLTSTSAEVSAIVKVLERLAVVTTLLSSKSHPSLSVVQPVV